MPNISNDGGPVDYIAYFTKQLPQDLARMAELRDELEKRQGAMTAVDKINAAKVEADEALAQARREADAMTAAAKSALAKAKAKELASEEREKALTERENAFAVTSNNRASALDKQAADVVAKTQYLERDLASRSDALTAQTAKIEADRQALDARIQSFQTKVAALNV